jgi:dihydroorotase
MTILVRKALIVDPHSPFNNSILDILIKDGVINQIAEGISGEADIAVDEENLMVSPGWVDLFSNFNDPGFEHRETLESGADAAASGGFTQVFVIPNTNPVIDSKGQVEYIIQKSKELPVTISPLGAVTKKCEGKELAEMYDMRNSGAVAFSDGIYPVQNAGLLLKALQYVKAFNGTVIQVPVEKNIAAHGLMHEGIVSTRMGLPGIPVLAEELAIKRDIELVRYTGSKIHFTGISTVKSVELIKAAKAEGLNITCSVTPYHLYFSDEDLKGYDTNLKVSPPLRTKDDVAALRQAVVDGDIDCIATHHFPHHTDNKIVEFEYAKDGMIGLETCFGIINAALPGLKNEKLLELMSLNARIITGIESCSIAIGSKAELSLFNREQNYTFEAKHIKSRSLNSPLLGHELTGRVIGTINKGKLHLN